MNLFLIAARRRRVVMSVGSLFLHPADARLLVSLDRLKSYLRQTGFTGEPIAGPQDANTIGDRFLQLVTFMGCSPHIELEPRWTGDEDFCHIRLHQFAEPVLLFGSNTRPPRCPGCRKASGKDPAAFAGLHADAGVTCANCGKTSRFTALEWRRDAGLASIFVEVRSVFPGEAVPVDALLDGLANETGSSWRYFYLTRPAQGLSTGPRD
jgi:hypothetical protein